MKKATKKTAKKATKKKAVKKKVVKKKTKRKVDEQQRKRIYKEVDIAICQGKTAITSTKAKELLGWKEVPEGVKEGVIKFGDEKAFLENNVINRPINNGNFLLIKQEILRKKWRFNGETIIIGESGLILDGQHTLIALVLAVLEWEENPDKYPDWKSAPTLEKVVVFGVGEDDETVNTINTGKPRSLSDVLFRSVFLAKVEPKNRNKLARILDYAIRLLWERTGVKQSEDAFGIKRSHAESLAFLGDHEKLVEAAKHIFEEDEDGNLSKYLSPGSVAALLYLQGTSKSDPDKYIGLNRNESQLDFDLWDDACDFWVLLAGRDSKLKHLQSALDDLWIKNEEGANTHQETIAVISKAWIGYLNNKITENDLQLNYHADDDGVTHLAECPTMGGIDKGIEFFTPEPVVTPEEVEDGKKEENGKRTAKKKKATKKKKVKKETFEIGQKVWVDDDPKGEPWSGVLTETYEGPNGTVAKILFNKKSFEAALSTLSHEKPEGVN